MAKNAQRQSQVVSTFGPGSMVDLPTRSVVVAGLEYWDTSGSAFRPLEEPRLTSKLEKLLKSVQRLDENAALSLRMPPVDPDSDKPRGIDAPIFPTWFVCERVEPGPTPDLRRRRLVHWRDLESRKRNSFTFDDGKKSIVTPIRFVCACKRGHLDDINWRWVVHGQGEACQEPMWMEERGTSAEPGNTWVVCGCGKRMSLQDTFQPNRLGPCKGNRPWLLDRDPAGCTEPLKLLIRTATNTYFPQIATVISLPARDDELSRRVVEVLSALAPVKAVGDLAMARLYNDKVRATLGDASDEDVFGCLLRIRGGEQSDTPTSPKIAEFDAFASGRARIGQNGAGSKLFAETLPRPDWCSSDDSPLTRGIVNLVAVHRLREVSCLYGFTRFEAAPTSTDGDFEDVALAVDGAPISRNASWLPAVEQFGEGLFVHFDASAIRSWLTQPDAAARDSALRAGYQRWASKFGARAPDYPGTAYILLHSLSHVLMTEIALDCGYPASSLKERVYALSGVRGGPIDRCGILIYTASSGAQGTLGGLVGTAPRFSTILHAALERAGLCSNDPICADHEPDSHSGDRATHGAACHGCLLIAETSCESRNLLLDRALLVPTLSTAGTGFFCFGGSI